MKKISTVIVLIIAFQTVFASPLIFKVTTTIESKSYVLIGTIDSKDLKQIRYEFDYSKASNSISSIKMVGVVDSYEFDLTHSGPIVASPPETIKFYAKGEGQFSIYVWGSK